MPDDRMSIRGELVAVLTDVRTGKVQVFRTRNIVTDAGDLFYAERAVGDVPTNFTDGAGLFDGVMELYNGASPAPAKTQDRSDMVGLVASSEVAMAPGYPKVNDGDAANTGAGTDIVTYLASYTTSQGNDTGIADVILTNPSPGASEPILLHAVFAAPFAKTSQNTLQVFINHTMNGV